MADAVDRRIGAGPEWRGPGDQVPPYPGVMARSSLTLAASATAALPGRQITGTSPLGAAGGRFDSALLTLDDGSRVVVRASTDDASTTELATESLALRAMTAGARALLPFALPHLLGEAPVPGGRVQVTDFVGGYTVEAADLPAGPGAASSIGGAVAAIHDLPTSVVRVTGLPARSTADVRQEVREVIDRSAAMREVPVALVNRWRAAVDDDALWVFDPTVTLGEVTSTSFRFSDVGDVPTVTGVLGWGALSVGDPATDLQWVAGAAAAANDVFDAYAQGQARTPDAQIRIRARLYAEMEFAKWLLHGHDLHQPEIVADAQALLDALVDGLGGAAPLTAVTDATLGSLPDGVREAPRATQMETDAYRADMSSLFAAEAQHYGDTAVVDPLVAVDLGDADAADTPPDAADDERGAAGAGTPADEDDPLPDVVLDPAAAGSDRSDAARDTAEDDPTEEIDQATRAAFQRWTSSSSE